MFKALVRALLAPAPDPRESAVFAIQRQRELLQRVHTALVAVAAARGRLDVKAGDVRARLPALEAQARDALREGREDRAALSLQRRRVAMTELEALEQQRREIEQEEHRLVLVEQRVATQMETFFARKEALAARYSAAEAQARISEMLTGVAQELTDLGSVLEQAEEKAEGMQARASAIDGLIEAGVLEVPDLATEDAMSRQINQLGLSQTVEEDLAALKKEESGDWADVRAQGKLSAQGTAG